MITFFSLGFTTLLNFHAGYRVALVSVPSISILSHPESFMNPFQSNKYLDADFVTV